jgi:NAD(P)H dehydrogenase (quinone)
MQALIVYAHPNPRSFNAAILKTVQEELVNKGINYRVRDLYARRFNPLLTAEEMEKIDAGHIPPDIAAEQRLITEADLLIFISPIWWSSFTTMMHGYISRVFSKGFAYGTAEAGYTMGCLGGKRLLALTTCGVTNENGENTEYFTELSDIIRHHIFGFVGMEVIHKNFIAVNFVSRDEREKMLEEIRSTIRQEI